MAARPLKRVALPFVLLGALAVPHLGRSERAGAEVGDFFNVVAPAGADPWVYQHTDGRYYMTVTTGTNIVLRRSATLSGVGGGERKVVWTPPASGANGKNLWAPELHYLREKWYVYYAADDGDTANHRMFVLENASADPFRGRFVNKGKVFDRASDRWAIDGTVLEAGGKLYFLWSGWEGPEDVRQNLYIAPMSNPWTLAGRRVEIARPTHPWETRGGPPAVLEGPQVLVKGRSIHVVYSAAASWTDHYCLGLLTARAGSDLLDPSSWRKHPSPVFRSGNGVFGPGHGSFVKSPDGKEDWLVYHSARYSGSGWVRHVRAQPFSWNDDGTPRFGVPSPPNAPIRLPGGDPRRHRYEAEDAKLAGAARVSRHPGASLGAMVGSLDAPGSSVEFQVRVKEAAGYTLAVRFRNASAGLAIATHKLRVNDRAQQDVRYEYSGKDTWSNAVLRVELTPGVNRVWFGKGERAAELDCLDVFPTQPTGP
ncbi:MAG: family 43 glycosylhydrolase [Gemmataceae bacterium]